MNPVHVAEFAQRYVVTIINFSWSKKISIFMTDNYYLLFVDTNFLILLSVFWVNNNYLSSVVISEHITLKTIKL